VVHFNVTEHPTAQRMAKQLVETFPLESAPKYLLRDRDAVYGEWFQQRAAILGTEQVLTAPRSPWQNAYAERVIGSIRRACLEQVLGLSEGRRRRLLANDFQHHRHWRTHLSLGMKCPDTRPVHSPEEGAVVAFPDVGGLHRHYERMAA